MDSLKQNKKQTIIVIDDNDTILDSYKYYISNFQDYILKGAYSAIEEALKEYYQTYPDIIISDISMPKINGIDGIQLFKEIDETVKIIMISVHDDLYYILDSVRNMADGYLTKPINKKSLLDALDALSNNGAPLSTDVSLKLIKTFRKEKNKLFSDREHGIIELFTRGYTYKSIAEELFITPSTVNYHIQNIYCKLDVKNKSEALKKLSLLN